MPRKKRPLVRDDGVLRDASLIVIASEDTYAVKQYFSRFITKRIQYRVLPTVDGNSAPAAVVDRLRQFQRDTDLEAEDRLWVCFDRDRWPREHFHEALRESQHMNFGIALCVPSFDLWVLLHMEDVPQTPVKSAAEVVERIRELCGAYTKKCCGSIRLDKDMVDAAMRRAKALDYGDLFADGVNMCQVYKLLELMIEREAITIGN